MTQIQNPEGQMRYATVMAQGQQFWGAMRGDDFAALSPDFPQWPSLRHVIAGDALPGLQGAAETAPISHAAG
ncbi:MAG: hypothetical protein ACO37E_06935, partial [Lutimaribacter sp.]